MVMYLHKAFLTLKNKSSLLQFIFVGELPKIKPILRTVENDLDIIDDPMEEEYVPAKVSALNRKANLQLRIVAHNNDLREKRSSVLR